MTDLSADARILWRLLRGQTKDGSHAANLERFYAPQADRYDAFRARLLHGRKELIEQISLRPGHHVVELGCGTGSSLETIGAVTNQLKQFDMVDLCPALLSLARKRGKNYRPVNVIEADATSWKPSAPVDVVFMSYSLTMMPHWQLVLANAHAMLAPNGIFGIVDFHLPEAASRLTNTFWQRWFAHDGVHLSGEHLTLLQTKFSEIELAQCRASVPYLPILRAPYYRFVGRKD
jgi:S-adenosylmethionine-diacylgycerolhomoserine-N-methlytransferase